MTGKASLKHRVAAAITGESMILPGEKVLVAVSGGVDSVVLLHLLAALSGDLKFSLHAAHLNHGLRGDEADADERFVTDLCRKLNVPVTSERRTVEKQTGESTQQAARRVRYRFLRQVAAAYAAARIATGHHADDLAETFLMRMLSGAGLKGLSSMANARADTIRPLLGVRKDALIAYAKVQSLAYREDASNADPRYVRNRVRKELLPVLTGLNPNLVETLGRESRLLADEERYMADQATHHYQQVVQQAKDVAGHIAIDAGQLAALPVALARRVVQMALVHALPGPVEWPHVEAVRELARSASGRQVDLPGGHVAMAEYGRIRMGPAPVAQHHSPVALAVPGITPIPWANLSLEARYRKMDDKAGWVYFDPDSFSAPLTVRTRHPGDRFCPSGMGGHSKKLKNFLIDTKVPRRMRADVPVLAAPEGLLWVVGTRQDERFMVKKSPSDRLERHPPLALRIVTGATASAEKWKEAAS